MSSRKSARSAGGGDSARSRAQAAQVAARDLLIRIESRRSTESSVSVGVNRMFEQRARLHGAATSWRRSLAGGDEPILQLEARLDDALARRLEVESDLSIARGALEDADAELRSLDEKRVRRGAAGERSSRSDGYGAAGRAGDPGSARGDCRAVCRDADA